MAGKTNVGSVAQNTFSSAEMKKACTVVALRPSVRDACFEVLMVQRKVKARFFAGAYVFPGGVVEETDLSDKYCVMRELFEEAGILMQAKKSPSDNQETESLRKKCTKDPSVFQHVVDTFQVDVAGAETRLKPFSHWVTPKQEKWRYSTMFYLAALTECEAKMAAADQDEVFAHVFATPQEFLQRHAAGEISLPPPTWLTLMELCGWSSIDDVLNAPRSMTKIEPTIVQRKDGIVVALPGDCEHELSPPESTSMRRVVGSPKKGFQWVDTIGNTSRPHSSL